MVDTIRAEFDDFRLESVDISDAEELFELYGLRIPVLRHADQRELEWPFSLDELRVFLRS